MLDTIEKLILLNEKISKLRELLRGIQDHCSIPLLSERCKSIRERITAALKEDK